MDRSGDASESTSGAAASMRWSGTLGRLDWLEGIGAGWQGVVFLVALALTFSRHPDSLFHAQFYAEDGRVWFAQAYNQGWLRALLNPQAGYMQTLARLVVGPLLLVPLTAVPLLMNVAGAAIGVLPVTALLSARCRTWGPLSVRVVMAMVYVAIPNSPEVHIVLTNAMWHLAVLQVLLLGAVAPVNVRQRVADVLVFGIGAVSGPYCLLLVVPAAICWWQRRGSWTLVVGGLECVGAVVQVFCILTKARIPGVPLGAGIVSGLRLLGGGVVFDSMLGTHFHRGGPWFPLPVLVLMLVLGVAVGFWGLRAAPLPLTLYAVFALTTLAASLHDPLTAGTQARWLVLAGSEGCRYWYYPSLLFLWCAVWCGMRGGKAVVRGVGFVVLGLMVVGAGRDWVYPAFSVGDFGRYVVMVREAKVGDRVEIPIFPGDRMVLVKR